MNSMAISVRPLLQYAEVADMSMTPSEDCKSTAPHKKKYQSLMNAMGFENTVAPVAIDTIEADEKYTFNFLWGTKPEINSYDPLLNFLINLGICWEWARFN